jgi:hypothetical protein
MQDMDHSDFQGCYAEHRVTVQCFKWTHHLHLQDSSTLEDEGSTHMFLWHDSNQSLSNQYNKPEDLNLQHVI